MSELDEAWASALAEAESRARMAGHVDLAAYLSLRNANDLLRSTGISWLMETFESLAADANRNGADIQISKEDKHRFPVENAIMVGRLLTLKSGVRQLFIEAGWPRTPRDGIVRGGGLARGNIRHLGIRSLSQELLLVATEKGGPRWITADHSKSGPGIHEAELRSHISNLLRLKTSR